MTRIERLRELLPEGFEAALILNTFNRAYLTEFASSAGFVLVTKTKAWFIIDFRYIEMAKVKARSVECVLAVKPYQQVAELLRDAGIKSLMVEDTMTLAELSTLQKALAGVKTDTTNALTATLESMRMVKELREIDAIKRAQKITDDTFTHICKFIKPGQTERAVAAEMEHFMRVNGADGLAFSTICIAGVKTSMPHGTPDDNVIRKGDFVTMDFGALKDGYCSDMTRTVAVGSATDEMRAVYNTVLEAHLTSMEAAHAGIKGNALDKIARDIIYDAGYKGAFGHGLGHSLGLEVHEEPRASEISDREIPAGCVLTIEPGIYLEGRFGVRIENMILVTSTGYDNLTASPRELILV